MAIGRGSRLGSYEILSPLGEGGMGEVWRATHVLLGRPAAVKVIRPQSLGPAADPHAKTLLRRFEREARLTSTLRSPHTVQIYDFGVTDDGDFESDPAQSPFDWTFARTEGVEVTRDCTTTRSGECSLRIIFEGTQNLDFAAASQLTLVRPGSYRFHAFIRTQSLTTDQGIRFRIFDAETPARLDVTFGQFTGSSPWAGVEHDLVVSPETRLLQVQVIRRPSMKFDNKIGGTAWIDELKLEPLDSHSSQ